LKIIFILERERRVARVKDIATRKGVRMASVTGALRRMSKEGLVHYGAREFVELSPDGAELARKLVQREEFLRRFLTNTLGLNKEVAEKDACSLEHHLSPDTLGRLVALYQFMQTYGHTGKLARFLDDGETVPCGACPNAEEILAPNLDSLRKLSLLEPGSAGQVVWLDGDAEHRLDLVEKGILPRVHVTMEAHHEGNMRVRIKGIQVRLTEEEADRVNMVPDGQETDEG